MKLIDADALKSRLKKQDARTFAIEELNLLVDFAPIIDAVPVVRCKDCVSFHYSGMGGDNGILYCAKLLTEMQPTDFCSYGERKDDEVHKNG